MIIDTKQSFAQRFYIFENNKSKNMSESVKKVNSRQKEALVDFMTVNYTYLFGKFGSSEGKASKGDKWKDLVENLNDLGPPKKDIEKWKKVSFIFGTNVHSVLF